MIFSMLMTTQYKVRNETIQGQFKFMHVWIVWNFSFDNDYESFPPFSGHQRQHLVVKQPTIRGKWVASAAGAQGAMWHSMCGRGEEPLKAKPYKPPN